MPSDLRPGSGHRSSLRALAALSTASASLALGGLAVPVAAGAEVVTAVTTLSTVAITLDATGPEAAVAGDLVTYKLALTNTGDVVFDDGTLTVVDALCEAPPALLSRNGDSSPATFSPGETRAYSCQVATQAGQQRIDNTATATAIGQGARAATASDTASTELTQPAGQVLPSTAVTRIPATARLRGTVGCVRSSYAEAAISGRQIKSVTYFVNGSRLSTLDEPNSGGSFRLRLKVRSLHYGAQDITATVIFTATARTDAKTLRLRFSRCRVRAVQPQFTG